jgi:hypothetical protein
MTTQTDRDERTGRFLTGNSGGGRKLGARNKLGEQFISDLRDVWNEMGIDALKRCARDEPAQFCKIVAALLPKDLRIDGNIDVNVDVESFLQTFRTAVAVLGNEPPARLPSLKVLDAGRS